MSTTIKIKRDISPTLRRLSSGYNTREEGQISWPSQELGENTFALIASLAFTPKVEDHDKDAALWKTVNDCAKAKNFAQPFFLRRLRINLDSIHSGPIKSYAVIAQLNVPNYNARPSSLASINGPVTVARHMKQWELKAINGMRADERNRFQLEDGFLFLRHSIRARHDRTAIDHGHRALQFTVGLLNLASHGYGLSHRSGMPDVPLGKLLLASSTKLIKPSRKIIGDWLVESRFPHVFHQAFSATSTKLDELAPYTRNWVRQIKATDFPERLTSAVILFQEGVSSNHIDTTLIKLWTCIELLCARPDQKEPLERVIERAATIFADPDMSKLRLTFIADSRHAVIHRGEDGNHALLCAQWASFYAAELIGFCAFNRHHLKKHDDILEYLSVPRSTERIEKVIKMHRLRLKGLRAKSAKQDNAPTQEMD